MRNKSSSALITGIRLFPVLALALAISTGATLAQDITEPEVAGEVGIADPLALQDEPVPEQGLLSDEQWKIRYRRYVSWQGPVGGLRLVDPISGAPGSVRFQLGVDIFSDKGYLSKDDEVDQLGENLAISWTAIEHLEVYGSIYNNSTVINQRDYASDDEDERVENDYHSLGDAVLGIKSGAWVSPVVALGGDLGLMLPNKAGSVGVLFEGIGVRLRGGLLADFRNLESRVPLLGRFNMSYLFDHTEMLADDTEKERFSNLAVLPDEPEKEMRQLISREERFGLGINRVDQLGFGLGFELPLEAATDFYLQPLLEWQWGIPINRRDYLCPAPAPEGYAGVPDEFEDDSCLKEKGVSAFPMTLNLAIRVVPPVRGLSALAGVEFGLTGTSDFVRELQPTAPYRVLLALGYDYDARPGEVRVVEKPVEVVAEPSEGRVLGTVTVQGAEKPVVGAAVSFAGHEELSAVQTGEDGRFASYPFEAGSEVEMELSHPGYEPARCSALIPAEGGDKETSCWMSPLPDTGRIKGRVVDQWGSAVPGARVELMGPSSVLATTDANGVFEQEAQAGAYAMRVEADGYLIRSSSLTLASRGSVSPELMLSSKPSPSKVSLQGNSVRINGRIRFLPGSSEPDPSASALIAELADLLLRNPQLTRVRIEGPMEGALGDGIMALNRAVAVKQRLTAAGVAADRIEAVGGNTPRLQITVQ